MMLFAAGFGTRMRPLTDTVPKPLIEVGGRALIDHTLDLARALDPRVIVVNGHYRAAQLATHLAGSGVIFRHETPDILDTGGGLKAALPDLGDGPVYTSNTDAIWSGPNPFRVLRDNWDAERMDALLLCVPVANANSHAGNGDFTLGSNGRLARGPGLVFGGVQIIQQDPVMRTNGTVFSLNRTWDQIAADGRLFGVSYTGSWCDVGSPAGIAQAERMLESPDV